MAVDKTLRVTRDQFAKFIESHDTMRQFEILFDIVNFLKSPSVVEILDATNIIDLLPLVSEMGGSTRIYRRTGVGAGTLTLNTQGSEELILLNGTSVSTVVLSGEETLAIYASEGKLWVLIN